MSSRKIPLAWLKGFDSQEEMDKFSELLRHNRQLFTVLRNILDDMYDSMEREEAEHVVDFSTTDWAYKQAHRNGRKGVLRDLKQLTNFIEG